LCTYLKITDDISEDGNWDSLEERKRFFTKFAAKRSFDPFRLSNWKKVSAAQINAANVPSHKKTA